jgi:hypothetical protein
MRVRRITLGRQVLLPAGQVFQGLDDRRHPLLARVHVHSLSHQIAIAKT